jgi:ribosomal protein L11 methyltransferase
MPWLEVTLPAHDEDMAAIESALEAAGAVSITLTEAQGEAWLEPAPGAVPAAGTCFVTGLFEHDASHGRILTSLRQKAGEDAARRACLRQLEDREWVREWLKHFQPMRFGKRLWIVPTGYEPPEPAAVNLLLDPGLAFGTGTHATTALCLEYLDAYPPAGLTVLDYGCGSGVLAVAAALLGAEHVVAVDHDPQALTATRENAIRNGVSNRIAVCAPDNLPPMPAGLLIANIILNTLLDLRPRLAALIKPGGALLLSGIMDDQLPRLRTGYEADFHCGEPLRRDGWAALPARKPTC